MVENLNVKDGRFFRWYRLHCGYCGSDYWVPLFWLKLRFLFCDDMFHICGVCHRKSCYRIFFNLVHDSTSKEERLFNSCVLFDGRILKS